MKPGTRVEYKPKERTLIATVREVSECGRLVKIFKRSRTHWIAIGKLKLTNDDQTTKNTQAKSDLDTTPKRENSGSAVSESRIPENPEPENLKNSDQDPIRETTETDPADLKAPGEAEPGIQSGGGKVQEVPELHRGKSKGRRRQSDMPRPGSRRNGRSSLTREEREFAHGQAGLAGALPNGSRVGRRKSGPGKSPRTSGGSGGMGETVPKPGDLKRDLYGPMKCIAYGEGYVVAKRPRAVPFLRSLKEWNALPDV